MLQRHLGAGCPLPEPQIREESLRQSAGSCQPGTRAVRQAGCPWGCPRIQGRRAGPGWGCSLPVEPSTGTPLQSASPAQWGPRRPGSVSPLPSHTNEYLHGAAELRVFPQCRGAGEHPAPTATSWHAGSARCCWGSHSCEAARRGLTLAPPKHCPPPLEQLQPWEAVGLLCRVPKPCSPHSASFTPQHHVQLDWATLPHRMATLALAPQQCHPHLQDRTAHASYFAHGGMTAGSTPSPPSLPPSTLPRGGCTPR